MSLEEIEPEFAADICDEVCMRLSAVLPLLLPNILPHSEIWSIAIKPYPTQLKIGEKHLPAGASFRVSCTCRHGVEQIILGEHETAGWLHLRVPMVRAERQANATRTSHG